ncbi:MAG TPA: twin-arginine translocase TatA/TatE family subunit [Acidobacteriota bacterium]|nr:twin-arginine translocase TatA/TatE family subunit [Acidobacteriota bacterium]
MFGPIGWVEILIIFGLIMLLFGARKLPEIGRGLGKAISNFKRSVKEEPPLLEEDDAEEEDGNEDTAKKKSK